MWDEMNPVLARPVDEKQNSGRNVNFCLALLCPCISLLVSERAQDFVMEKDGLVVTLRDGGKVKTHEFKCLIAF